MTGEQEILRLRQLELARPPTDSWSSQTENLVGFRASGAAFAVPLTAVHAIRSSLPPTPLPQVPAWLLGIVAVDGVVVPMAAPDILLGYADAHPLPDALRFVVLRSSGVPFVGLALDTLDGPLPDAPLQPLPAGAPSSVSELAAGLVGEHLVLDVPALGAALRARLVPGSPLQGEQPA